MAGLNANVTLGPGVVPISGQVNVPPGVDEVTFGDAFAEAQAVRLNEADARDAAIRRADVPGDRPALRAAEAVLPARGAGPAVSPAWSLPSGASADLAGAPGAAVMTAAGPGAGALSRIAAGTTQPTTASGRPVRRGRSAAKSARAASSSGQDNAPVAAGAAAAPLQADVGAALAAAASSPASGGSDASPEVGAVGAIDGTAATAAPAKAASATVGDVQTTATASAPSGSITADVTGAPSAAAAPVPGAGPAASSPMPATAPATKPVPSTTAADPAAPQAGLVVSARTGGEADSRATGSADAAPIGAMKNDARPPAGASVAVTAPPLEATTAAATAQARAVDVAPPAGPAGAGPRLNAAVPLPTSTTAAALKVGPVPTPDAVSPATPLAMPDDSDATQAAATRAEYVAAGGARGPAPATGPILQGAPADPPAAPRPALESLQFTASTPPLQQPASDPAAVPTVTSLPGAPGRSDGASTAGTPGASGVSFPSSGSQTASNWASAAVPVIVKPASASARAGSVSFSGRAVGLADILVPAPPVVDPATPSRAPSPDLQTDAAAPEAAAPEAPAGSATVAAATSGAPAAPGTPPTPTALSTPAIPAISAAPAGPASPAVPAAATVPPTAGSVISDTAAILDPDPARLMPRVIRHGGPSFVTATHAADGPTAVAPVSGAAPKAAGGSDNPSSASQSETAGAAAAATASGPPASASPASALAASAASGAAAVAGTAAATSQTDAVIEGRSAVDLADAADRLMSQAVSTIHSYQTAAGPSLEARISDPRLGDVRVIVTGRAGEIVQAQLVVRDRVAADAVNAAAARMHSTSDALAGVSLTVRSDGNGSATNGRAGGSAFEAAGWATGNGYGAPGGSGSGAGTDPGLGNQNAASSGNGAGGDGSREAPKSAPVQLPDARPNRQTPATPLRGGPSLDVRA